VDETDGVLGRHFVRLIKIGFVDCGWDRRSGRGRRRRRDFEREGPSSSERRRRLGDVEVRSHSWRARRGSKLRRERWGGVPECPRLIRQKGPPFSGSSRANVVPLDVRNRIDGAFPRPNGKIPGPLILGLIRSANPSAKVGSSGSAPLASGTS